MQLGPYAVLGELGRGGMGLVYRGRAPDGRDVAIKVLKQQDSADAAARFEREKRLLGALGEQDGFVPLLDAGAERGAPYLVMPFLAGGTLRAKLQRGPFAIDAAVALGRELAQTLGRAHERGIVHRDLKPENILFTAEGRALVADLGIAKHFDRNTPGASQSVSLSGEGQLRGTAGYMAPEQLRDAATVAAPADVFALGAILYECVTGSPAFTGESLLELVSRVELGIVTPLRRLRPDAPRWLEVVIGRALAREPAKRLQDGRALDLALRDGPLLAGRLKRRFALKAGAGLIAAVAAVWAITRIPERGSSAARIPERGSSATRDPERGSSARNEPRIRVEGPLDSGTRVEPPLPRSATRTKYLELLQVVGDYRWNHGGSIASIAFSPSGDRVASGSDDRSAKVWDVTTGDELASFSNETKVRAVAWHPDGVRLVTTDSFGTLRVWDTKERKLIRRFETSENAVNNIAFDRSGALVCSGVDEKLRVIDVNVGAVARLVDRPASVVGATSFSKDAERAAGFGKTGQVVAWDTASGRVLREADMQQPFVNARISTDGKVLVASIMDGLTLFDVDGQGSRTIPGQAMCPAFALAPDGSWLVGADVNGTVTRHVLDRAAPPRELQKQRLPVQHVAASPDGKLAVWGRHSHLYRHDVAKGETLDGPTFVISAARAPDGKRLVTAGLDGKVRLFEMATGALVHTLDHGTFVQLVGWRGDQEILSVGTDGSIAIWSAATGAAVERRAGTNKVYHAGSIAPDGSSVALGSSTGMVEVHNVAAGSKIEFELAKTKLVEVDHRDQTVWACSDDGFIYCFELATSTLTRARVAESALQAAFAKDGSGAVVADTTVRFSDMKGSDIETLGSHPDRVTAIAIAPDSTRAVTASYDGTVILWDMKAAPKKELDRLDVGLAHDFVQWTRFSRGELLMGTARGVVLRYALREGGGR